MTKNTGKQPVFDEAFKREAVRILATGGRTVRQAADDLGVGFSTLNKWKSRLEEAELRAGPHDDVMKELARLRRENEDRLFPEALQAPWTANAGRHRCMRMIPDFIGSRDRAPLSSPAELAIEITGS